MTLQTSAQNQLRQLVEQIERLEEEKKATAADIRDKYVEAKAVGFDIKVLRKIISLRKKSETERQEEDAILETYLHALGMLGDGAASGADARVPGMLDAAE
jgi:uncharacterized protein (UPF0335 family)